MRISHMWALWEFYSSTFTENSVLIKFWFATDEDIAINEKWEIAQEIDMPPKKVEGTDFEYVIPESIR